MKSELCLTCSSELRDTFKEKPAQPFYTSCCHRPICSTCLSSRPSLKSYCVFCHKATDAMVVPQASTSSSEEQFIIDDSDEDYASKEPIEQDGPPSYSDLDLDPSALPSTTDVKTDKLSDSAIHYIQPSDTLTGIAFQYKVTPRLLAKLNKFSPAILSTNPSLLHTRPFLILPPGVQSQSSEPLLNEEQERQRLQVLTFQKRTKCVEQKVAELYLNEVYRSRANAVFSEDANQSELDEAIRNYQQDLDFEARQKAKGKWTGIRAHDRFSRN